ncbi:Oligopeptide/dipeptide ABC transporter, ATP-binding protein [Desulfonema limicola]|uniref:Oligopeptide/dipeptide ABC transporter, ATP-binding protein n=1 Tax=Desulfonema limicola TaxID=45656 RepID=A0A975BCT2_9BACT|nr:ABC transporter ATP-binding protein [Desulfonema limicola]QTA82908.1 Oligopeptide/dipeptide ABC transporter, ATP-binding protein [Desulfonema limicola]
MNSQSPVICVENLQACFFTKQGVVKAVDDVSFSLKPGMILGIAGESGSGKSVTALALMGLLDKPGRITRGKILFCGQDITNLNEKEMRQLRGCEISMIFQDALSCFNPVLRIDTQIIEVLKAHHKISSKAALEKAEKALVQMGIPDVKTRIRFYPHQFSGGMLQRIAIAIATLNHPKLIIADEPTTSLDVTIQRQILGIIQQHIHEQNTALIWITHDLGVIAGLVDEICIMYAGLIVEYGNVDQILDSPLHPYTMGLINSVPATGNRQKFLKQIPGIPPSRLNIPSGCAFRNRCSRADSKCLVKPELTGSLKRQVRCFHPYTENFK